MLPSEWNASITVVPTNDAENQILSPSLHGLSHVGQARPLHKPFKFPLQKFSYRYILHVSTGSIIYFHMNKQENGSVWGIWVNSFFNPVFSIHHPPAKPQHSTRSSPCPRQKTESLSRLPQPKITGSSPNSCQHPKSSCCSLQQQPPNIFVLCSISENQLFLKLPIPNVFLWFYTLNKRVSFFLNRY